MTPFPSVEVPPADAPGRYLVRDGCDPQLIDRVKKVVFYAVIGWRALDAAGEDASFTHWMMERGELPPHQCDDPACETNRPARSDRSREAGQGR